VVTPDGKVLSMSALTNDQKIAKGNHATEVFLIGVGHDKLTPVKRVKQLLYTVKPNAILFQACIERVDFFLCPYLLRTELKVVFDYVQSKDS
jgi:hypothetical protein